MKYKTYTTALNVYSRKYPYPPQRQRKFREVWGGGRGGARKVISEGVGGGLLIMEIPGSGGADMTALLRLVGDLKQKCPWVWIVFGTTQQ